VQRGFLAARIGGLGSDRQGSGVARNQGLHGWTLMRKCRIVDQKVNAKNWLSPPKLNAIYRE
jgi:hypothetical protein